MLSALLNGELVLASNDLPRTTEYRCPYAFCSHPELILKKGVLKVPHFAHKHAGDCFIPEPETDAHLAMKQCFQQTLGIDIEYLEYGKIRGVRPDIVWQNYAIELQHSPIKVDEIDRRNTIYAMNHLFPVWVFHRQEFAEDDAAFSRGCFGIETSAADPDELDGEVDEFIKLKAAELHVLENIGGLFYLAFSKDKMYNGLTGSEIAQIKDPGHNQSPKESGWFFCLF